MGGPPPPAPLPLEVVSGVASLFRSSRSSQFATGRAERYRDTDVSNPAIPTPAGPMGGIDITKNMAGMGEFVVDPMQNFRAQPFTEGRSYGIRQVRPGARLDANRYRRTGTAAYNKQTRRSRHG